MGLLSECMYVCMFVEEEKTRVSHYKIRGKTIETRCTLSSYSRVVVMVNTLETKICDVSANKTRSTFIKCQILHLKTLKREEERE